MQQTLGRRIFVLVAALGAGLALTTGIASADSQATGEATLYERLGEWDGINQIVRDTIANH